MCKTVHLIYIFPLLHIPLCTRKEIWRYGAKKKEIKREK
jgi:hypothetical protein